MMKPIRECQLLFIAGVEGSGTTLMLQLLDRVPDYVSLGGNFISDGYQETGERFNELTERLWKYPAPSPQEHKDILLSINDLVVGKDINTVVYKRSYPFSGRSLIPKLGDIYLMGKGHRIILMRRHFFENVNSILRRNFEDNIDSALSRIYLGYRHLYKQIHSQIQSEKDFLTLDYQRLVDDGLKQSEISEIIDFLHLPPSFLTTWGQMIRKPNKIRSVTQRNLF
ncbi:MAG TPA: hypothetical protein EYP34_08335 [Chromatiaceae bacterium]|nr:hypothetical protein [Chromatiaceae bacterium]